jgi:hypothetical protein
MRSALIVVAILLGGCASAPKSEMERVALKVVADPKPSCQSGHEGALSGGALTILPGETICVSLQVRGDSVVPGAVVSSANPENTLIVRFWQEAGSGATFLTLHNPLATYLGYQAHLLRLGASQREYTTSCPVLSRRVGIEQWPYQVSEITLSNFASLPESNNMVCK